MPCFEYSDDYSVELKECVAFIELVIDQQKDVGGLEFCIIGDFNINMERIFKIIRQVYYKICLMIIN